MAKTGLNGSEIHGPWTASADRPWTYDGEKPFPIPATRSFLFLNFDILKHSSIPAPLDLMISIISSIPDSLAFSKALLFFSL